MGESGQVTFAGQYKVDIYDRYLCSCVRFDLQVCDMSQSSLEDLDTLVRKFIRRWCRMPQSTHIGHVLHSSGLNIELPSDLFTFGHAATLMSPSSCDSALHEAVDIALNVSTAHAQKVSHASSVVEIVRNCSNKSELKNHCRNARDSVVENHSKSCIKQGGWLEALAQMDQDVKWKASLSGLSEPAYLFVMRALVDALPTNSNLAMWKKISSSSCQACGSSKQTLLHVLNNCQNKLDLYTWRHNNILLHLKNFIMSNLQDCDVYCDIAVESGQFKDAKVRTVPSDIFVTNLRPDIVIVRRAIKHISLLELTVPFESNIAKAQERKADRYSPLVAGLQEAGYDCDFLSLEIGSRGIAAQGTCRTVRSLSHSSRKDARNLVKQLCNISVKCSYLIFLEKDNSTAVLNNVIA